MFGFLGHGIHTAAAAAVAYPSNSAEDERASQHGDTTEEEGGHVTSCDVHQQSCRKKGRRTVGSDGSYLTWVHQIDRLSGHRPINQQLSAVSAVL